MDDHTEVPQLEPEPDDPAADVADVLATTGPARGSGRRRRREPEGPPEPVLDAPAGDGPRSADVTEAQLVRAFYWLYKGFCKLIGSQVDAKHEDFRDLGRAWIDLARKVPGIRWLIALAGPLFTFTDLLDKLARAWTVRSRFRERIRIPSWRQRSQAGAEAPDVQVVDGGTGAP